MVFSQSFDPEHVELYVGLSKLRKFLSVLFLAVVSHSN